MHVENITREVVEHGDESIVKPMQIDATQMDRKNSIEAALIKINGIISTLKGKAPDISKEKRDSIYKEIWSKTIDELLTEADIIVEGLEAKATSLYEKKNSLESKLSLFEKYEPILEKIQPLARQICTLEGFESIALLVDKQNKAGIDDLKEELKRICKDQCDLVSSEVDDNNIAVIIIYNKIYAKTIHDFLSMENVNEIKLPSELSSKPFETALDEIHSSKKNLPQELAKVTEELEALSSIWHHRIIAVRDVLRDRIDEIQMIPQFGTTGYTFVITGWMPDKEIDRCKQALIDEFFGKVALIKLDVSHHEMEKAPVALSNPPWAKPFEFFYSFVKLPRYGGVDPTPFMAIFFPIIFGMMVGDIGYGLIILGIALLLKAKSKGDDIFEVFSGVLKLASIGAIIWGFLYLEAFGDGLEIVLKKMHIHIPETHIFGIIPFPLNRLEFMSHLLVMAVVMGMVHVGFGLVFGMINGLREHQNKHVIEKAGMFCIFIVAPLFLVIGVALNINLFKVIGGLALFAGVIGSVVGGGIKGLIEIFGTMSNIFSYSRIMAIGLAGVILGAVANRLGMEIGGMGGVGMMMVGFILAALLHAINIIVSTFSPSIHTLRLHLVECFTKFYEPAECEYKPFKKTGGEK
ncbi:hypothetical protein HY745_09275 [Candidatus Desantisbacteria bacterium]|nr:hypothetical protein [Candidatus Desantisbacteria bacterium]